MRKKLIRLLPALITIIVAGVVFCCLQNRQDEAVVTGAVSAAGGSVSEDPGAENRSPYADRADPPGQDLWVYVCGEVFHPGVYCLEEGARVFEAIEMAGGMTEHAAEGMLNLASEVQDGQQIVVPDIADLPQGEIAAQEEPDGRININTASEQELMTLPGIGEAKARAIIAYRQEHLFTTIEEIMLVSGIKENSFNKIRHLIRV